MRSGRVRGIWLYGFIVVASGLILASCAADRHGTHWGYAGRQGPEYWGSLDKAFALCETGKNQSPVDITGVLDADLAPIRFDYQASSGEILNNGHAVQVNVAPGNRIIVDGDAFALKQFHFHAPSENRIDGRLYDMEAHLVHADKDGNLAVIGVLFERAGANPVITALWAQVPENVGEHRTLAAPVDPLLLLPADKSYVRFNGSLTTPPCSEGVRWLVMKSPMPVSARQADTFTRWMHGPTNRPVQPIGARLIVQ